MNTPFEVKILLVDDDEGHTELVKLNLERSGLINDILHFSDGKSLLDFLLLDIAQQPDNKYLIILDINMPGMDGHQVLKAVKRDARTKHIPIIMLTTTEDENEIDRCYTLGCNFYLTKPIAYEDLCEAVQELGLFLQKTKIPGTTIMVA